MLAHVLFCEFLGERLEGRGTGKRDNCFSPAASQEKDEGNA
jgi:hypothetical protein